MKALDRFLQRRRMVKVLPFIPSGARVLDIGCGDGVLFRLLGNHLGEGIGLDPTLSFHVQGPGFELIPGDFPDALPETEPFDVITVLAVLEHIPEPELRPFADNCVFRLKPGGLLIITTPSPHADYILNVLIALRLIDGMSLMEHHGFDPQQTHTLFSMPELKLVKSANFQLYFNNLFIFQKAIGETI